MLKNALSEALTKDGTLVQRMKQLNDEQQDDFLVRISRFMKPEHGFFYANGEYHHLFYNKRIESRATLSTTFGQERRAIHFEFYDSPGIYHYQKSHDDAYFTDEVKKFVGKVMFRHHVQLVHDTDIFSKPQEIWLEFGFTTDFAQHMEDVYEEMFPRVKSDKKQ